MSKAKRRRARPSVGGVLSNLAAGGYNPLERARRVAGNLIRRRLLTGRRKFCCGNYGDPGC
jgi:hypothetical protein